MCYAEGMWRIVLAVVLLLGGCADPCEGSQACLVMGRCVDSGEGCVVGSDEDCRASLDCVDHGACTRGSESWCVAASDGDCLGSVGCGDFGECWAADGECVGP